MKNCTAKARYKAMMKIPTSRMLDTPFWAIVFAKRAMTAQGIKSRMRRAIFIMALCMLSTRLWRKASNLEREMMIIHHSATGL